MKLTPKVTLLARWRLSQQRPSRPAPAAAPRPGAPAGAQPKITFIQGVAGDEFYISMQCGIEAAARSRRHGQHAGPGQVRPDPAEADRRFGRRHPAGRDADRPHRRGRHAGATEGRRRRPESRSSWSTPRSRTRPSPSSAIASDNKGGGLEAFEAIKKLNPDGGKVLVISTDPGISTADARVEGLRRGRQS